MIEDKRFRENLRFALHYAADYLMDTSRAYSLKDFEKAALIRMAHELLAISKDEYIPY